MKRLIHQLLQYIRLNQQQKMHYRRQLVSQKQRKKLADKKESSNLLFVRSIHSKLSSDDSDSDHSNSQKVYHQGNSNYDVTRRQLYNWIAASEPTHFLTVQFPLNMRSPNIDVSKNNLRRLMARFEQCLIGSRWAKSHLPFFTFAEVGPKDGYTYHFHLLFNASTYNTNALQQALDNACLQLSLSLNTFYLEEVKTYEIIYYCLKEVKITNHLDCYDSIILSSELFGI